METLTYSKGGFYIFPFNTLVRKSSIVVENGEVTGEGGNVSNIKYLGEQVKKDVDGTIVSVCSGIQYYIHLVTSKRIWLDLSVGCGVSYYDIDVASTLTIKISSTSWEESGDTAGEADEASIEYEDLRVIVDAGFNLKCVDKYHRDYLGYGEIRADYSITNGLIPSREAAKRIARREIFKTGKSSKEVVENLPPNFFIVPGSILRSKISSLFIDKNVRIQKLRIAGNSTFEASYNVLSRES